MPHRLIFLLAPLLLVAPLLGAAAAETGPKAIVETFHANLLAVMKEAQDLGSRGRYQRLSAPVVTAFNLGHTLRIATGSFWRRASPAQKGALTEAFTRMTISTYASQFDGFSGQVFEILGERAGPGRTKLVATRIISPAKGAVGLTYVVEKTPRGWQIVDILLGDDISQLAVRRSEYRGVLRRGGIEALISDLNRKAEQLIAE